MMLFLKYVFYKNLNLNTKYLSYLLYQLLQPHTSINKNKLNDTYIQDDYYKFVKFFNLLYYKLIIYQHCLNF